MKQVINKMRDAKFRDKLTFSTLIVALIPLLLFSMLIGSIILREIEKNSGKLTQQMVTQTSESLDIYIGTIEKLMDFLGAESDGKLAEDAAQSKRLEEVTAAILKAYPEIAGITIAYSDDSYLGEGMTRISRDRFADESWYQYAVEKEGQLGIIGSALGRNVVNNLNESSDSIFSLVKAYGNDDSENGSRVVLFDIRHNMIEQLIERVSIGEEGFLYVVDESDIVYTPTNNVVYRIDQACYQKEGEGGNEIRIQGKDYFVMNCYSSYSGWRTVGVVPQAEFSAGMNFIYHTFLICAIICIILAMFASVKVSATATQPILRLCNLMAEAEAGDFSVRFDTMRKDEIGLLGVSFNHMIEKINELINELYVEKQYRLEAQLKSLQEQIKPHFLYNTLDTISWLAREHGAMDVVGLVDALTNMFRVGLSSGRDFIMLREEKKHVVNYLYIQKVRYGERLQYEIKIPHEYDEIPVPKLILQPLVENAIYHGVKKKRTTGRIEIDAQGDGKRIYIRIRDDGAGISPGRLAEIREWLEHPENREKGKGFGLSYMEERIELTYGPEYGIKIDSQEGEFTEVAICLPIL